MPLEIWLMYKLLKSCSIMQWYESLVGGYTSLERLGGCEDQGKRWCACTLENHRYKRRSKVMMMKILREKPKSGERGVGFSGRALKRKGG